MNKLTKGIKGRDWELNSSLSSLCRTVSTNVGGNSCDNGHVWKVSGGIILLQSLFA